MSKILKNRWTTESGRSELKAGLLDISTEENEPWSPGSRVEILKAGAGYKSADSSRDTDISLPRVLPRNVTVDVVMA